MAQQADINHPPSGGFEKGAWYWDPAANQARRWTGSTFGAPGQAVAVDGEGAPSTQNSGSPLEQVNQTIQDSFQKLQDEVVKRFGDYTSGNPFKVDQVLAGKTNEAKEQIDPYYNQLLGDYLTGVQRKIDRGTNDTKDLLSELSSSTSSYTESSQNNLNSAIEQATQGFADNGLANSGAALRASGQLTQSSDQGLSDYLRKAGVQQKQLTVGNQRNIEDVNAASKDFQTNLGQEQYTAEQTRASQLTKEAGQQYIQGFQATLPTPLQNASGFDMLKSLGIYS